MVSYLGFPILLPDWTPFGTICILDCKANPYSDTIYRLVGTCRDMIQSHLELLCVNVELSESNRNLRAYLDELQVLRALIPRCASCKRVKDGEGRWSSVAEYLNAHSHACSAQEYCPDCGKKATDESESSHSM